MNDGQLSWARMRARRHLRVRILSAQPTYNENQDFGFELVSRLEAVAQHANEKEANRNHAAIMF